MLKFNFKRIFRYMGIEDPVDWLVDRGFDRSMAFRIYHAKYKTMDLRLVEALCRRLHCDVHNLLEWEPNGPDDKEECLKMLKRDSHLDMKSIHEKIPAGKEQEFMEKVAKLAEEFEKSSVK